MSQPENPSWAWRRVTAMRKGEPLEPIPGPLEPWDDHSACFRESLAQSPESPSVSFCNDHGIGLFKQERTGPMGREDYQASAVDVARAAMAMLSPQQREEVCEGFGYVNPSD